MPDWAVVLIAAFGGGLAGAVLQPVTAHVLERIRREEEIRKSRERTLRRMIAANTAWVGKLLVTAGTLRALELRGAPAPQELRQKLLTPDGSLPPWRPHRIADPALRDSAGRFGILAMDLLNRVSSGQLVDVRAAEVMAELLALDHQMTARMDELNWPEVDD